MAGGGSETVSASWSGFLTVLLRRPAGESKSIGERISMSSGRRDTTSAVRRDTLHPGKPRHNVNFATFLACTLGDRHAFLLLILIEHHFFFLFEVLHEADLNKADDTKPRQDQVGSDIRFHHARLPRTRPTRRNRNTHQVVPKRVAPNPNHIHFSICPPGTQFWPRSTHPATP